MPNEHCEFVKPDGTRGQSYAVTGSTYCFSHDPNLCEAKREATHKGGENRRKSRLPPIKIDTLGDLPTVITNTINAVRAGQLSSKDGNAIAKLVYTMLRIYGIK